MKLRNGGLRRRLAAGRLVVCAIVVAVVILGWSTEARAAGIASHVDVGETAAGRVYGQGYPDLATLLRTYPKAVASGSVFPDWGYSIDVVPWHDDPFDYYSEVAHEKDSEEGHEKHNCDSSATTSYRDAFANYLQNSLSPPYSEDELKTIAFLYGLISHVEADDTFDSFIGQAQQHWADSYGRWDPRWVLGVPGHPEVDMGVDAFNLGRRGLLLGKWEYEDWFFPVEALAAAYDAVGCREVSAGTLTWAMGVFTPRIQDALSAEAATGLTYFSWRLDWALSNYMSATGGMGDMYRATAAAWENKWNTWKPVTTIGLSPAAPDGDEGAYRQPVTIQFEATAFLNGQIETWYSLDSSAYQLYIGPFTVSSEGIHDIAYYSVDLLNNAEDAPIFSIKEDAKSETVEIDRVDEPCPAGPQPSGECNLQPPPYYVIINGQQPSLNRDGSGCSPFILRHPECTDCGTCNVDVQSEACKPYLTGVVPEGQTEVVYEMCQTGTKWRFRVRTLDSMGNCPIDEANPDWLCGLPPGTGIKLPTPVIVGGLAILGAGFMAAGLVLRRRKS